MLAKSMSRAPKGIKIKYYELLKLHARPANPKEFYFFLRWLSFLDQLAWNDS